LDNLSNMVLDPNDQAHFSYTIQYPHETNINGTVGYATWDGTTARTETVTSSVTIAMFTRTDLAVDRQNNPHIEFFNGSLMYASRIGSKWDLQTVAPDKYAYSEGPIALDGNGAPYICYWVDDIHNTQTFVSQLLITSTLPLAAIELPQATPASEVSASATQLWKFNPACPQIRSPTLIDSRIYFLTTYSGAGPMALYCIDRSTGAQIWNKTASEENYVYIENYAVADGRVYIGGALPGTITCLDAKTGALLWNYTSTGTGFGSLTVSGGVLYAGGNNYAYSRGGSNDNGLLIAFDASTGKVLWSYTAPDRTRFDYINPLVKDGIVYAISSCLSEQDSSWQGTVLALDASSGKELWNYKSLSDFNGIAAGDQCLYVSSSFADTTNYVNSQNVNGKIYQGGITALNLGDGAKTWDYPTDDTINSLAFINGTLYAVSDGANVYSFDATNGRVIWSYTAGISLGNLIDTSDYLYVGSSAGVYCLDKTSGRVIWNYAENSYAQSSSTKPTFADGRIYVGWNGPTSFAPTTQHNLYALDAESGQRLWNYTLPNVISNAPIVEGGVVYVGGDYVTTRNPDFMEPAAFYALKSTITQQNAANNGLLVPAVVAAGVAAAFLGAISVIKRRTRKSKLSNN
jgi:outer membrane protein assembly factor BamB